MRTSHDIRKKETEISPEEKKQLETIIEEIKFILASPKVNEGTLNQLKNVITSATNLKENYTLRIIRKLKQNHMLD